MSFLNFLFPLKLKSSAKTDQGKKRAHNEDAIYCHDKHKLYIVADGIGGHGRGEYASQESIRLFKEILTVPQKDSNNFEQITDEQLSAVNFENANDIGSKNFPQLNKVISALHQSNHAIYTENQNIKTHDKKKGMGTTFSGCWFLTKQQRVILFNLGDSRVYLFRDGILTQRTHDHSMHQHWLDHGMVGEKPPKNIILRAIGPREEIEPDIEVANIQKGDTWLICSDGLHGMLEDQIIETFLEQRLEDKSLSNYKNFAPRLVDKANYAGGLDNISVVLIHVT